MARLGAKALLARHEAGEVGKNLWRHLNRDAYRYTQPARDIIERPVPGQNRMDVVFDSTGVKSSSKFANKLQDLMFPMGKHFVAPQPGPRFDEADESVRKDIADQLGEVNEKWHAALWRSNFASQINPVLQDLAISTGAMLFNEGPDWDPFHFQAVPQFMLGVLEGPWGTISDVSREIEVHPAVAAQMWPDNTIPNDQKAMEQKRDNKRVYVEIVYADYDDGFTGQMVQPNPLKWYYAVVDKTEGREILRRQREYEVASPWIIARYQKAPNEVRGRGPVLDAIGHIRVANKLVELILKNGSLAVSGLWTALDDGVFNPSTATFTAGSVIPVASNGGTRGPTIQPLEFPGNFDVSQILLDKWQETIKEALFDNELPPIAGPVRTATEFVERLRNMAMDIGPAAGRIQKELMEPLYLRGLHILNRKGIVQLPKDLKLDSQNISLNVVSPLARRQAFDNLEKVAQWVDLSLSMVGPEVTNLRIKTEQLPDYIGEQLGVDPDLLRNEAEQAQIVETVTEIVSAQQQQAA